MIRSVNEEFIIPVTDGKKIPIKMVNAVVESITTWLYVGRSSAFISSGSFEAAMYCPSFKK